ncbi:PhnE/PtxC family ABC transporter permease [Spiroplasma clarkii]|uniref:PhnE/PtxC family ABC transporter permease n=1 Tax=Spiroplasma clarkii TaxID=2139 RepID=UPI0011BADD33|nr:ABC transporter permease subunit [Spiroplasma clarkii]
MKSRMYLATKQEMQSQHEKFLQSLTVEKVYKKAPLKWIKRAIFYSLIFALFVYSVSLIDYNLETEDVIASTNKNLASIFKISWASIFSKTDIAPYSVVYLLFETLSIAIVGTFLGAILAFILGLLSSETIVNVYVAKIFVTITSMFRAIPTYIYAIIFVSLVGLGPFNGAIALAMGTTGMLTKYNRELFEDVNFKIVTQLQATGLNAWERFRYGIMPQTTSGLVSYVIYRFDINFKEVVSLGIVGAGTMGYLLNTYFGDHYFAEFGALLFGIMIFTLFVETVSTTIRNKINLGVNPKFMDNLILFIKNKNWIVYKANAEIIAYPVKLNYDESRALYAYTNQQLFILVKKLQKTERLSYKTAYVRGYCAYFKLDLMTYAELKTWEKNKILKYKIQRKDYLSSLKQNINKNYRAYNKIYIKN